MQLLDLNPDLDIDAFLRAHPSRRQGIAEPKDETIIWKYLDLAKYLAFLKSRCLHMAPATEFWDRYEGDIGTVQKRALIEKYGKEKYDRVMSLIQALRKRTYVSCWTENEFESDAMWRIYTGANYGVAIQSTYGCLKSLMPGDEGSLIKFCGKVNYIDFKSELLDLDSYCLPYFYKRRSFEHEREVRILIQDVEHLKAGEKDAPAFRQIPLDQKQIDSLVQSIHLSPGAPPWFKDLVREVSRDYGLDREPIPSALGGDPDLGAV